MEKAQKEQVVDELNQAFASHGSVVLVDFTGVNVADETELRRKLLKGGGAYRVVKNRLALRAAVDTPVDGLGEHFRGPTAVALSKDDPVGLAKALTEFLKGRPDMVLKAGVVDREVVSVEQIEALAKMPSREELLSKLAYVLMAPVRSLAAALQSPVQNLASVLGQIEEKKQETK